MDNILEVNSVNDPSYHIFLNAHDMNAYSPVVLLLCLNTNQPERLQVPVHWFSRFIGWLQVERNTEKGLENKWMS